METQTSDAPEWVILPAIDLRGGKCVRLRQGRAEDQTVYADDPLVQARDWVAQGARYLHVVDLDGAFQGHPAHVETIRQLAAELPIPLEVGGGIRSDADMETLLDAGAARVILGTRACDHPDEARRLAARYGERLAVGIDGRNGLVQVRGWTQTTGRRITELAREMDACGVATLIVTDTGRDGMLNGVNAGLLAEVCDAVSCRVIASGGVSSRADVVALRALRRRNLAGAIVGKALYENQVTLPELNAVDAPA